MQVQSIQATNNCRKPCFKAYFVNDSQGIFNSLWEYSSKTPEVRDQIRLLVSKKNHPLEIVSVEHRPDTDFYRILNRFTGKYAGCSVKDGITRALYSVLKCVNNDIGFFEEYNFDEMSKLYRCLTGQDKPQIKI